MALQKLPVHGLDDINHRRRHRETTNSILKFEHDDSRIQTAAEVAAGVTPVNYAFNPGDVRRYGADPTGVTAADAAFALAVLQAKQVNGAQITFPGTYRFTTGIVVNGDEVHFRGDGVGASVLLAGANNITVLKIAGQHCSFSGFTINGSDGVTNWTGVNGLVIAPVNETTGGPYYLNNNTIIGAKILNCAEGVRLRAGPTVFDQVYFNTFLAIETVDCIRNIWIQLGGTAVNRNYFFSFRAGSTSTASNTGLQIDDGSGNEFHGLEIEGMLNGTSPNATPQGVIITAGTQNDANKFYGGFAEACSVGFTNANSLTQIFGFSVANCTTPFVYTAIPPILIGGTGASVLSQVFGPFIYQSNSQIAGYENNTLSLTPGICGVQFNSPQSPTPDAHTLDDYEEKSFTPTIFGSSTPGTGTYTTQVGTSTKIGNRVYFELTVAWSAHTGTGDLNVGGLPYAAASGTSPPCSVVSISLTFANQLGAYVAAGSTSILMVTFSSGAAAAAVPMDSAATLQISGAYHV